jgi:Lhr-like helicase
VIFLTLSNYELAYLEIKRILIQYPIISKVQMIDENEIDKLHETVKRRIDKKPEFKERIWHGANRALLKYIKKSLTSFKPSQPYDYMTLVDFLKKDYSLSLDHARLLSKAIQRLDKYLEKHFNYFFIYQK